MNKELLADIFKHQLTGIMFHADAYCVSVLHGYKRLKMAHCRAAKEETANFMCTRYKSIEQLGEIIDIPPVTRIDVPHDATARQILNMWLKWEMEAAEVYSKAVAEDPECKMWQQLHQNTSDEIKYISRMKI